MADTNRFRLKQTPTDVWSIRERLALASSVSRSGDQNWVSVSRAVRPFGMLNRPSDWFSQKNCALQYSELLENVETPRRKRNEREAVETPGDVIVRKLTIERIEELKKLIAKEAEDYRALKKDLETVRSGQCDSQIKEMWEKLQTDKAAAAAAASKTAADESAARERAKAAVLKYKKSLPPSLKSVPSSDLEDSTQDSSAFDPFTNEDSDFSLALSVPTPGPSQATDAGLGIVSPVAGSIVSPSPKSELQPTADDPISKDLDPDSVGSDRMSEVKIELKQQESPEEKKKKMEVDVTFDATVKIEEQDLTEEEASQKIINDVSDELEIKAESSASGKVDSILFDKDEASEDELIALTPDEDEEKSQSVESKEVTVEESGEKQSTAEDVTVDGIKEEFEEVTEEPVFEVVEELLQVTEEYKEEEEEEEEEKDAEEKEEEDILLFEAGLTEETVAELEPRLSAAESEPPKAEDTGLHVAADPASPSSSIVSAETGSVHSKKSNRRGRGRRPKRTRKVQHKVQLQMEEEKESELSSKEGETSDEEGSRVQPAENEDSNLLSSLPLHLDPNESLPNSPASLSHSDTEDEKSHRVWKKSIMLVWRAATNHKCASVFLHPVTEDIAPGYHSIVHKPMDLQKIKRKIDNGEIRTTAEFQRDMMLMFTNAIMYNNSDHDVHRMAKNMYKDVMGHIEQFVSTQIMVQAEPKLLRTLRRADFGSAHSDKEDDAKRKRSVDLDQTPSSSGAKVKKRKL